MIHLATAGSSPAFVVSGLLVGTLVGLTGVGGGSLMTPLLVLLFGIHPSTAVGTDLLFAATTKSVGTLVHHAGRSVDWRVVGRLALGSLPATGLALAVIDHYGAASATISELMSLVLGVALLLSAASLLVKDRVIRLAISRHPDFGLKTSTGLTVLVGFAVGLLVALSSVGAGALGTVSLLFLYPRMASVRVVGSDIAHAVPLTLIAGLGHWYLGSINGQLLATLLLGSVPGILLGSWAAQHMSERFLRPSLGLVLALVGWKMLTVI